MSRSVIRIQEPRGPLHARQTLRVDFYNPMNAKLTLAFRGPHMGGSSEAADGVAEYSEAFQIELIDVVGSALSLDPFIAAAACFRMYAAREIVSGAVAGWHLNLNAEQAVARFVIHRARGYDTIRRKRSLLTQFKVWMQPKRRTQDRAHGTIYNYVRTVFHDGNEPDLIALGVYAEKFDENFLSQTT